METSRQEQVLFSMSHDPKYQTKTMKLRNISGSLYSSPHSTWWRRDAEGKRHKEKHPGGFELQRRAGDSREPRSGEGQR